MDSKLNSHESIFCAALAAKDASSVVKASSSNEPGTHEAQLSPVLKGLVKQTQLTAGESKIVYGWKTPNNNQVHFDETVASVGNYYIYYGKLPASFTEVLAKSHGGHEMVDVSTKDPSELVNLYARAYNPITGKIYGDCSNPNWSPGGLFIKPLALSEVKELYPGWTGNNKLPYPSAFRYKVFGEEPGSVLAEDTLVSGQPPANDPNESEDFKDFKRRMEEESRTAVPPQRGEHTH